MRDRTFMWTLREKVRFRWNGGTYPICQVVPQIRGVWKGEESVEETTDEDEEVAGRYRTDMKIRSGGICRNA